MVSLDLPKIPKLDLIIFAFILVGLPPPPEPQQRLQVPAFLQQAVSLPNISFTQSQPLSTSGTTSTLTLQQQEANNTLSSSLPMDIDEDVTTTAGGDLENELREFLESGPGLHAASSSTADDNNLMDQLLMN